MFKYKFTANNIFTELHNFWARIYELLSEIITYTELRIQCNFRKTPCSLFLWSFEQFQSNYHMDGNGF